MKVKILTSFPKQTYNFDKVYFSSDLHLRHQSVIDFGRKFTNLEEMNNHIISEINRKIGKTDLLVLMGDTIMIDKDYEWFLNQINCFVIILYGNHCNIGKLQAVANPRLLYTGYYLELNIEGQIVCCQHYPTFNWNYQDDGAISLHGHLHADESNVVKEIHKYRSMDVGIDSYYNMFGEYSLFSYEKIQELLKDKLIIGRHEN